MSRLGHTAANFLDYWKNKGGLSLILGAVLLTSKRPTYQFKTPKRAPITGTELQFKRMKERTNMKNRTIVNDANGLYYLLRREGIRTSEVAKANGVSRQTIHDSLKRDLRNVPLATFQRFANAMELTPGQVVDIALGIERVRKENLGE